jgi:histidine triad (HIT) family protein
MGTSLTPDVYMLIRCLERFTRSTFGSLIIGWIFVHMSYILPVKRLRDSERLLAFYHPSPGYPVHILIVPKAKIVDLLDIKDEDGDFILEVFRTTQSLVEELGLDKPGYRLILNGGKYQEFPHLHFHLISGGEITSHSEERSYSPKTT